MNNKIDIRNESVVLPELKTAEIISAPDILLATLPKRDKYGNKLEPESEHFFFCPECLEAYMRPNLQRIFCSHACKDRYHNRKKRKEKIARELESERIESIEAMELKLQGRDRCIEIIEALKPTREGIKVHPDYFFRHKFDFNAFTGKYPFDSERRSFYLTFGNYRMCLWSFDQIIVQDHTPNNLTRKAPAYEYQ